MSTGMSGKNAKISKWMTIISLVLAGEMIFSLPFHIARFFRPTFLEVFQLTNTELGDAFAIYGITAMIAYFPGGPMADKFSVRKLITLSLLATGAGGIVLAQIPGTLVIKIIFGYWGISTIFLFWAAMIKATREWGGKLNQGKAFGLLDGGRGLVAAGFASIAVMILNTILYRYGETISDEQRILGMKTIIYFYSFLTISAAFVSWIFIPETKMQPGETVNARLGLSTILTSKITWLLSIIIVCSYCGYKGLDYYSLYLHQILGFSEVDAARFVSNASYLRAFAAIGAGFLADRFSSVKIIRLV
jgi:MFS family permease